MQSISIDAFTPLTEPFKRLVRKSFLAQGIIVSLICCMILLAFTGLFFTLDAVAAISLASLMLLIFLLYVARLYFKESLFQSALDVKNRIEEKARKESFETGEKAELFSRLALATHFLPVSLAHLPKCLNFFESFLNRVLTFVAWSPLHTLGEVLFLASVDEHIHQIRKGPTNLPLHAALANLLRYALSPLQGAHKGKASSIMAWHLSFLAASRTTLELKAEMSSKNALEELTILQAFAPDELWVHDQLAISYKELKMPEKEIEECEAILRLCPDDHQAALRLGILYFTEGQNAKGLEIYEQLKDVQPLLAEDLIEHYGSYQPLLKRV